MNFIVFLTKIYYLLMTLTKRERIYKSAYDWINNQIDDYFTIVGLKHRGKVPVGETQYEYAIYEPANRETTCGRVWWFRYF